jgi:5-formyltetrahydrofolate cyclo-ligase
MGPSSAQPKSPAQEPPQQAPSLSHADVKSELRRHFRQQRRQAVAAAPEAIAAAAAAVVPTLLAPPLRLGLYWPIGHEPDLRPLCERLPSPFRARLALPAIRGEHLLYLPWQPGDPLAPDGAGIPAPLGEARLEPTQLGLLLVPSLAVDFGGLRLGSGGGWYDRLRSDQAWRAVPALAVLPATCVVPALPQDPWDVPFTGWLDETGVHLAPGRVATS